jgi:hypothetical protein
MAILPKWLRTLLIRAQSGGALALIRASANVLFQAVDTAQEKGIAVHVRAVIVDVIWLAAVGAASERSPLASNRNDEPIVEHKEFPLPMFSTLLQAIIDDPAIELKNLFKTLFFHDSGKVFTPNAACAAHHDAGVFRIPLFFQLFCVGGKLPKSL